MNNILHICFSITTRESLKLAISKKLIKEGSVIAFLDDLSKGPIENISYITGRIDWYEKSHLLLNRINKNEIIKSYEIFHSTINKLNNEDIYIWYGDNCVEICGLLYTLNLLNKKTNKINFLRSLPNFSENNEYAYI